MIARSFRIKDISVNCMLQGEMQEAGSTDLFNAAVKILSPLIEKVSLKAMALANLNRTVHLPTYNKIIADTARKLADMEKGGGAA